MQFQKKSYATAALMQLLELIGSISRQAFRKVVEHVASFRNSYLDVLLRDTNREDPEKTETQMKIMGAGVGVGMLRGAGDSLA